MSDDRELLELAARAIGYELHVNLADATQIWQDGKYVAFWNPLTDDGDALQLAVKLRIGLLLDESDDGSAHARQLWSNVEKGERYKGDRFAATRRAIVRAAAEIGRTKPHI